MFWDDSRFEIPKKFGTTFYSKWCRTVVSIWPLDFFWTPAACSGCQVLDTTEPRACNLYQTPYSRLKRLLLCQIVCSIWQRTIVLKWQGVYDYRFQMTHGSRGLWISPREPNFFALKFSSWKSGGAISASWRKRSKVWLSISRREWSNLWLYGFTVENMAICGYGQKFDYRFQDETVGSLAMSFYGRKFGYTRLWSKVCLCLSWRKWRICWRKWWINS